MASNGQHHRKRILYADDDLLSVRRLLRLRTPSLLVGLLLGVLLSFVTSRFENVLSQDIRLAYFIPFVVYMADAVGTQTQSIYTRDLRTGQASFRSYLFKESLLGLTLGVMAGFLASLIVLIWFSDSNLALTVGLATWAAIATAPLVALLVTTGIKIEHSDPAVGAGPLATVVQDTVSVLIYGLMATIV